MATGPEEHPHSHRELDILSARSALHFGLLTFAVLKLFCKINAQLAQKRYYPALKAMQELENVYLPRVSRYTFATRMRERVPLLRKKVKTAAHNELQAVCRYTSGSSCRIFSPPSAISAPRWVRRP